MNAEVKQQWMDALRSGDYKQGQNALRKQYPDEDPQFCCLGVLCDLAVKAGVVTAHAVDSVYTGYGEQENTALLPAEVREWSGVSEAGEFKKSSDSLPFARDALTAYNDVLGKNFNEIADVIEKYF